LSGAPLRSLSRRAIATLRAAIPRSMPIIAVGGIDSAEEALAALEAGADLVQVYTGLVYRGPKLITQLLGAGTTLARTDQRGCLAAAKVVRQVMNPVVGRSELSSTLQTVAGLSVLTPSSPPTISTSAGRLANKPTVTTPAI
jgi:tRNA-dihydrouridine synthase